MNRSVSTDWSVSTDAGLSLPADEFVEILSNHHDRLLRRWLDLDAQEWAQPSRNRAWSVHDTARHVADAIESGAAQLSGEPSPFSMDPFDPRVTPDAWLAASADDPPQRTIERFAQAAARLRTAVGERLDEGDRSMAPTVYGPAHWSVGVVHVLWDSWLHERDVALPLGRPVESTPAEQRVVALYGLMMAMLPARMMEESFTVSILVMGPADRAVTASHHAGRLWSAETSERGADLSADLCAVVDSLSGRGQPVAELLPGAPELLGAFGAFMAG